MGHRQTVLIVAFNQGLHCLATGFSIKNIIEAKK